MQKILIVSVIFVAALGTLLWVGVASAIPDLSVAEVLEARSLVDGAQRGVDSPCQVKDGKVLAIESLAPLRFSVASRYDATRVLAVTSDRSVPDNFRIGIDVGLRGTYQREKGVFEAYRVTTKCPSKYEASKDGTGGYEEPGAGSASGSGAPSPVPPGATQSDPSAPGGAVPTTSQTSTAQAATAQS